MYDAVQLGTTIRPLTRNISLAAGEGSVWGEYFENAALNREIAQDVERTYPGESNIKRHRAVCLTNGCRARLFSRTACSRCPATHFVGLRARSTARRLQTGHARAVGAHLFAGKQRVSFLVCYIFFSLLWLFINIPAQPTSSIDTR